MNPACHEIPKLRRGTNSPTGHSRHEVPGPNTLYPTRHSRHRSAGPALTDYSRHRSAVPAQTTPSTGHSRHRSAGPAQLLKPTMPAIRFHTLPSTGHSRHRSAGLAHHLTDTSRHVPVQHRLHLQPDNRDTEVPTRRRPHSSNMRTGLADHRTLPPAGLETRKRRTGATRQSASQDTECRACTHCTFN